MFSFGLQIYNIHRDTLVKTSILSGKPIDIIGDGRSDLPGFSAKYGTNAILDENTEEVIHFYIMHSEIAGNSVRCEKEGLIKCLDKMGELNIALNTLATDGLNANTKIHTRK